MKLTDDHDGCAGDNGVLAIQSKRLPQVNRRRQCNGGIRGRHYHEDLAPGCDERRQFSQDEVDVRVVASSLGYDGS